MKNNSYYKTYYMKKCIFNEINMRKMEQKLANRSFQFS